jgi:hypothetical protein
MNLLITNLKTKLLRHLYHSLFSFSWSYASLSLKFLKPIYARQLTMMVMITIFVMPY